MKNNQQPSIDINYVARLANLPLTAQEKKVFEKQLINVLDYFSKLTEVKTENVKPIGHITGLSNITRDDHPVPSISSKDALTNAPKIHNGFFEVDAIFKEE